VLRCLSSSTTGHEFLQFHADQGIGNIEPGHFFKTLKSSRRHANITSLNDLLAGPMTRRIPDPCAQCAELADWDIYAVDGHYQHAARFDPQSVRSEGGLRAVATGHFFRMNMHSHHLSCLGMANPEDGVVFTYMTHDFTLPAYQIVLLYKHRWDIEKIFHQLESKMNERKSWASSLEAKQSHAIFESLAHNLLLLFEQYLTESEGLRDELE
jgi:hypothetical protein